MVRRVSDYLQTDAGKKVYEEFEIPWVLSLFFSVLLAIVGLLLVLSIVGIKVGFKLLLWVFRLEMFRNEGTALRKNPDQLRPMIAYGIIIGSKSYGLALGTFSEEDEQEMEFLARKAEELAELYLSDCEDPVDKPMFDLLRDDTYQSNRRRAVPEPHADGRALYLFDLYIDRNDCVLMDECVLIACVATEGETGLIKQIPWSVVRNTVEL